MCFTYIILMVSKALQYVNVMRHKKIPTNVEIL